MDFITHLPPSNGYTVILVVVDRFSKGAHFAPLPTHYNATKVALLFWETVGKLHGMPKSIISDRDPIFVSKFWRELFSLNGTTLSFSSAYHPQSDGQTERVNRCVEQYLRLFVHEQPSKWSKLLSWAEFHYNTAFHQSIGMTPFEVIYGRKPPCLLTYCAGLSRLEAVDSDLRNRDEIIALLKTNLLKAQLQMKIQADKNRLERSFEIGSQVLLRLQPYRQLSVGRHSSHKLSLRFYGPFEIIERIGPVSYRLRLPPGSQIHPIFHVSLLKPFHASAAFKFHPLPTHTSKTQPLHVPAAILAERTIVRNDLAVPQVLIQWDQLNLEEASWEDRDAVFNPTNLEDKVQSEGQGNVAAQPISPEPRGLATRPRRAIAKPAHLKDYITS